MRAGRVTLAISAWLLLAALPAIVQAQEAVPGIRKLDGATRAKALAALAGLIILGFGMVALIWLGARVTQRYRHRQPYLRPTPRPGEHDWAAKPLAGNANPTPEIDEDA
jgi:hypothetical protein